MIELVRIIKMPLLRDLTVNIDLDWERTSLRPYVSMLDAHIRELMLETREAKLGT